MNEIMNIDDFEDLNNSNKKKHKQVEIDLFKLLSNISLYILIGLGVWIALILSTTLVLNRLSFTTMCSLFIVCICSFIAMPWAKRFNNQDHKKLAIIFISMSAILCLLLIISAILIIEICYDIVYETLTFEYIVSCLNYFKIVTVFIIQFFIVSSIFGTYFNFGKDRIPLQVITAFSYLIIDIYLSVLIIAVIFDIENGIQINNSLVSFLSSQTMSTLLLISIFIFAVTNIWFALLKKRSKKMGINIDRRKTFIKEADNIKNQEAKTKLDTQTAEERLEKLRFMFDKNLISKTEYENKKKEILDNM